MLSSIAQLYQTPQYAVYTLGELDICLCQLHWLYADATERMEEFVQARCKLFDCDPPAWLRLRAAKDLHKVISTRAEFSAVIDEWKALDAMLGIDIPPPPTSN